MARAAAGDAAWVAVMGPAGARFRLGGAAAVAGRRLCARRPRAGAARRAGDAGGGEHDRRRDPRIRRPARLHRARPGFARAARSRTRQAAVPLAIGLGVGGARRRRPSSLVQRRGLDCIDRHRPASSAAAGPSAPPPARRRCTRALAGDLSPPRRRCGPASCCISSAGSPAPSRFGWRCTLPARRCRSAPSLAIESLLYATRTAAFVVPNAVGVQEGAYILLGAAFGLSPRDWRWRCRC